MSQLDEQPNDELPPSDNEVKILSFLHKHPHATHDDISRTLDINPSTVKRTMDQMRGKEWVERVYKIDPTVLGFGERYRVDIWVLPRELKAKKGGLPAHEQKEVDTQWKLCKYIVDTLSKEPQFNDSILVEDVRILLGGPADLSAVVRAKSNRAMLDFVTDGLRMCGAIEHTATCLEQRSYPDGKI